MNQFEERDYTNEKFDVGIWKKIIKLVLKRKKALTLMIFAVSALTFLDIAAPLLNAYAIREFFENGNFDTVPIFIVLYMGLAAGFGFVVFLFIRMAGLVEVEVGYELRKEAFKRLQELPFAYYDKTPAGWIMARLTSDSRRLASILSWGIVDMLWGFMTMIGVLIVLFIVKWELALIITALVPILFIVSIYFRKKILIAYRDVRKTNSKITASYNEGIMGNKTSKTLVLEEYNEKEFDALCAKMRKDSIKAVIRSSIFFPILLIISYVAILLTLQIGGNMVLIGAIGVSTLYLFISYTTMFFDPIMQVARILAELQQAQASAERLISLIETKAEIEDTSEVVDKYGTLLKPKKENWEPLHGEVEFKDVNFWYVKEEQVLKNFSLKVPKGTSVALVGATGSGKSTIVNLVCRFYEPTTGEILIDGVNYKERSIGWLHANLGYVLQSPHLFNTSILENIRYGRMDATDEEVIAAARAVSADEFVEKLDKGYHTVVGEGGSRLSVGQRQLISFARAVLADPKILILDEATSSIDTKTEEVIQKVTNQLLEGRTSFIVAHRLSTIINANIILVIEDGQIKEMGTHEELLQKEGEYYSLYKNQFMSEGLEKTKY